MLKHPKMLDVRQMLLEENPSLVFVRRCQPYCQTQSSQDLKIQLALTLEQLKQDFLTIPHP
jgi:hypothetical protein